MKDYEKEIQMTESMSLDEIHRYGYAVSYEKLCELVETLEIHLEIAHDKIVELES